MVVSPVLALVFVSVLAAQIPPALQERLDDTDPEVRRSAMRDLVGLRPSPALSAFAIASALAAFLQDPDIHVREAAAGHLGAGRPADIAVPALVQALAGMDRSWDRLRRVVARLDAAEKKDRVTPREIDDALATVNLPNALLVSLRAHHDERAVTGVAQALATWKLDRTPGATIERACEELCLGGTQAALDAVVDLLVRAQSFVDPKRVRPKTDPKTPAAVLVRAMRPLDAENVKQISAAVEAAVRSYGIELPAAFDGSAAAWKDVLRNHASKIPKEPRRPVRHRRRRRAADAQPSLTAGGDS